jgi:frataxin-like iron-binding protein CyaY
MKYQAFSYQYPPRPRTETFRVNLEYWEKDRHYVADVKKNGTCNLMAVSPDRTIKAMNRHKADHKLWRPDHITRRTFEHLKGGWFTFVSELMHSKVPGLRHINYIFDILVADSEYLTGMTFKDRRALLMKLFPNAVIDVSGNHYVVDANTWIAKAHTKGFVKLFDSLTKPEDEGLVIKNPNAPLMACGRPDANAAWQFKCLRA